MKSCRILVASAIAAAAIGSLSACGSGGGFPDAAPIDAPPPDGTVSVAWTVTDINGAPVTCDAIGAQAVTLLMHNKDVQGGTTEVFGCSSGHGTTPGYPPGTYDISFELSGPGGTLKTAPQQTIDIKSDQNSDLTAISFAVDATGGLTLTLSANKPSAAAPLNCAAGGGANIQTMTITLTKASDGSCATVAGGGPVVFDISAGSSGGTAGTYTVNCATPATVNCLQADQQLTVTGIPSGNYVPHVRAAATNVNPNDQCYVNDDALTIPALGGTKTAALNLGATGAACP